MRWNAGTVGSLVGLLAVLIATPLIFSKSGAKVGAEKKQEYAVPLEAPTFATVRKGDKVVLTGAIPDEESYEMIMRSAKATYGAKMIDDRIVIDMQRARAPWLERVPELIRVFGKPGQSNGFAIEYDSIGFTGPVRNTEARQVMAMKFFEIVPDLAVDPGVGEPKDPDAIAAKAAKMPIPPEPKGPSGFKPGKRTSDAEPAPVAKKPPVAESKKKPVPAEPKPMPKLTKPVAKPIAKPAPKAAPKPVAKPAIKKPKPTVNQPTAKIAKKSVRRVVAPSKIRSHKRAKATLASRRRISQFSTQSSRVRARTQSELRRLAQRLKRNPKAKISLIGHTDSVGKKSFNRKLGYQRAYAVKRILQKYGVSARQIRVISKGESAPIASNHTTTGRAMNRRVELKLYQRGP